MLIVISSKTQTEAKKNPTKTKIKNNVKTKSNKWEIYEMRREHM